MNLLCRTYYYTNWVCKGGIVHIAPKHSGRLSYVYVLTYNVVYYKMFLMTNNIIFFARPGIVFIVYTL